ncbi:MAG TPA: 4-alpha-glucanotransferase [Verrucomicrobiae bacterium]|nr:4-alpha-glucanotransferase [Verrucomicrobiae bacterium]
MNLTFRLRFYTHFGQSLFLTGPREFLGDGKIENAVPLHFLNHEFWEITVPIPENEIVRGRLTYNYILRNPDGSIVEDWPGGRAIDLAAFARFGVSEVLIVDSWNDMGNYENACFTEPFQNVLLKSNFTEIHAPAPAEPTHTFKVKAPLLKKNETLCIVGDAEALGFWSTAKPLLLNRVAGDDFLSAPVDLRNNFFPISYKYGVFDLEKKTFARYENGANRILDDHVAPHKHTIVQDGFAQLSAAPWRGAGVAIPVFSLRSETSFGAGDFSDLKRLADWASSVGLKLIQLLPINDTSATHSWKDSYPYAAISAFALHPIYLDLRRVATGKNKTLLKKLEPERQRLNALETVDYEAVMSAKLNFLKRIFASEKSKVFAGAEYQDFFSRNQDWLLPYAAFCYLRDQFGTANFDEWKNFRTFDPEKISEWLAENSSARDEISFHFFVQFHLHVQLKDATDYAHAKGIVIKGDIPIGVYRHGADAWRNPELFHMEMQAGAPPDPFSAKGQNWGFPTYNWPRMERDGFAWWKRRFEQMSRYFDAFRIDHILGFFRIWSIPADAVEGILGHFVPAIPVDITEFGNRGIPFDRERFTKPYVTNKVLGDLFGKNAEKIKRDFLVATHDETFSLKPEFATQRKIESHFSALEKSGSNAKIQEGLYDLVSNVILFEVENSGGRQFHFRLGMENTASFKNLPANTQSRLRDLYVDYFFRRQDQFWAGEAMRKLPAFKRATNMLVCGEDLGMVPDCVPGVMKQLVLLSLEVQRMPKNLGQEFSRPKDAPYLSVVTPSTHDMSTIRGWWEEDRNLVQKFFNQELGQMGEAPNNCEPWINKAVVAQHLASPAMWSIFQLQDLLGMDGEIRRADPAAERINVPAIPQYYWRYRMHLTLETLQQSARFNEELRNGIRESGR